MKKLLTENRLTSTPYLGAFILIIAILLTLPWLGLGHFYTRGEPHEALVAVAMMDQGNYILPLLPRRFCFQTANATLANISILITTRIRF